MTAERERITLRAERCACGGTVELREGETVQDVVSMHNLSLEHRRWRSRWEYIEETELRLLWGDR